jgi:hypothetical protein
MELTEFIDRREFDPSLLDLIHVAQQHGVDRFSYVRKATPENEAGVSVVLLSTAAERTVLPFLFEHVTQLHNDPSQRIIVTLETPLSHVFEMLDASKLPWAYAKIVAPPHKVLVITVTGPSVTEEFARRLTERGVTTSL